MWVEAVLATPVVLRAGFPFFKCGWESVRNRSLNMFSLISLGIGTAYIYSLVATIFSGLFLAALRTHDGLIPVYYEAGAVITVLVLLGQVLELRAREQTGGAIRALLKLAPTTAHRLRGDGQDEGIPLDQVKVGDKLRIKPGYSAPVNSVVLEGKSAVDKSIVTGESLLSAKVPDGKLIGGTINGTGSLVMRADRVGADTTLSRIVNMVTAPQRSRTLIRCLADKVGLVRAGGHRLRSHFVCGVDDFVSVTGKGVTGKIGDKDIAVGNSALLNDADIAVAALDQKADDLQGQGATVMYLAIDSKLAGIIAVADPIKSTTKGALASLRAAGVRIVMLTGDNRKTANAVADKLSITGVEAEILPEQKHAIVHRLKFEGWIVAMAGDGVNDAPALAEADVGVAIGTGTDVAIQSAGVTLVKGDLAGIARARTLSHATMSNIRGNLVPAFVYNALGVLIAAGVLYPGFGILFNPVVVAAAMSPNSVSVIGNALRLRLAKL